MVKSVALVVGASRGIGRQVAIDIAKNHYRVVVSGKTTSNAYSVGSAFPPDPNSPFSTINTVEREIRDLGGEASAIVVDTRSFASIQNMVEKSVEIYGRLDIVIYNCGAIWWSSVENTSMRRFQLLQKINSEGLYGTIQAALLHFKANGWKGRIIVVSPPIYSRFFRGKTAYAMGKVAMSVLTKGLAMDFEREEKREMAVTSIWPATAIESAATAQMTVRDSQNARNLRKPTIFSDAILAMLRVPAVTVNGMLELDEDFLRKVGGISDFSGYSLIEGTEPRRIMPHQFPNLLVDEQQDEGQHVDSKDFVRTKL